LSFPVEAKVHSLILSQKYSFASLRQYKLQAKILEIREVRHFCAVQMNSKSILLHSELRRCVLLLLNNSVSKEHTASTFSIVTMEIEVASSFVTLLSTYKSERSHKAQDYNPNIYWRWNGKYFTQCQSCSRPPLHRICTSYDISLVNFVVSTTWFTKT